ncbi:hypothetical protein [Bizionia myxarmorum]|uniref:LVIVD repeat-containing protein n=1 Tax=Bizionia myxarmorum TaxID=291186 RepID=A0A5D0RG93_9FLAO|nr:hypothetical protein [Bizionia myxarmorum]TYB79718.1 hypothetical protein ES674_08200 [Bizionia myxarmorum]
MKNIQIVLFILFATFYGCSDQNGEGHYKDHPCEVGDQGVHINESDVINEANLLFDDSRMVIQYVTGHPDGDYLHMYSMGVSPVMDLYTFAINAGDTSTLDQNFNVTAGSYLAIDGTPYPQNNNVVLNTIIGGSQVGDAVKMDFEGDYDPWDDGAFRVVGDLCVTIDEVVSYNEFVYITDGTNLKVVDVTNPLSPSLATNVSLPSSHYVKVINKSVAIVGQTDATEPYLNTINITNPESSYVAATTSKSTSNTILTDAIKLDNKVVLTDQHSRNKLFVTASNEMEEIGDAHGGFCVTNMNNDYLVLLDGLGASAYKIGYNFNLTFPFLPSNVYVLWTTLVGNRFDRIENDGQYAYLANVEGQKLVKLEVNASAINQLSVLNIGGHPSALEIYNNYAFITMSPTLTAPYNAGFDGIKMIDLSTMQVIDSVVLTNASGIVVKGIYAYVTDGNGLHIYDISAGNLDLISTFNQGYGNYISLLNY